MKYDPQSRSDFSQKNIRPLPFRNPGGAIVVFRGGNRLILSANCRALYGNLSKVVFIHQVNRIQVRGISAGRCISPMKFPKGF